MQLYKGDCLEIMDELIEKGVKVDCVITSPPYNIGKEYEKRKPLDSYLSWLDGIIEKIEKVLKENGVFLLNLGTYVDDKTNNIPLILEVYPLLKKYGFNLRQNIVWRFDSGMSAKRKLSGRYEDILWVYKGDGLPPFNLEDIRVKEWASYDKRNNPNGKNPTNVWHIEPIKGNSKEKKGHPCQFPVALIERLVKGMSNENDLILDPFMGSGSTGVACKNLDRHFIGIELDENYFNIAKERINPAE